MLPGPMQTQHTADNTKLKLHVGKMKTHTDTAEK